MCNQSIDVQYFHLFHNSNLSVLTSYIFNRCLFQLFQCTAQLIRARSRFRSTANTVKTSDNIVDLLATDQFANALKITITTTNKEHLLDDIILIGSHVD